MDIKEFIEIKRNNLNIGLMIKTFKEDGDFIAYCPSLNLCGQGGTEEKAKKSFEIVLEEFFRYTLNKKTLSTVLEELGWIKKTSVKKFSKSFKADKDYKKVPYYLLPFNKNISTKASA